MLSLARPAVSEVVHLRLACTFYSTLRTKLKPCLRGAMPFRMELAAGQN